LLDIDKALSHCNLVITGEGSLDHQSLAGKLPIVVAQRARARNVPTVAVVGTCRLSSAEYVEAGFGKVFALDQIDARCAVDPELSVQLLTQIGEKISHDH